MHPTSLKDRMNAWTAIHLTVLEEDLLNFGGKSGIFSAMLGSLPVFPGIIAALGNLQGLAQLGDRILVAVLCDELKFHSGPREKMPIAFFKISRSCRSRSFSRFKWRISSSGGV